MTTANWGKEQAEAHMKERPGHAAMGTTDRWTCADCDGIILELTPVCKVGMPFGQSGVPDFCGKPMPCNDHPKLCPGCDGRAHPGECETR